MKEQKRIFVYMWEFHVPVRSRRAFEQLYGPRGKWVRLFRRGKGYIGTELLKDACRRGIYFTIDYWQSERLYKLFRKTRMDDFNRIDRSGAMLTRSEKFVGTFRLNR